MVWLVTLLDKGASINYVDKQGGGRGQPNVNDITQAYLVNKFVNEGGGGSKILKILST